MPWVRPDWMEGCAFERDECPTPAITWHLEVSAADITLQPVRPGLQSDVLKIFAYVAATLEAVIQDPKVLRESPVQQETRDPRDRKGRLGRRVHRAMRGLRDHPGASLASD